MTPELADLGAALRTALAIGDDATALSRVCAALVDTLPCEAASVTVMVSDLGRQAVFAGDEVIRAFELAEYTVGEGPSLQAFRSGRSVFIPDTSAPWASQRWPGLANQVATLSMASVFCFPMQIGAINIGVCALYRTTPGGLNAADLALVYHAIELTTLVLLQLRGNDRDESLVGRWLEVDGLSRRKVHQAIGMVMVQLGVSAETAFARLRAASFLSGRDIEQVADDVVTYGFRLDDDTP